MEERYFKQGDLCKHFKGKNLLEKNIYEILAVGVIYTGTNSEGKIEDLVVYKNIFDGKIFTREYKDLIEELEEDKKVKFGQERRVEKLTSSEIETINDEEFKKMKIEFLANKVK